MKIFLKIIFTKLCQDENFLHFTEKTMKEIFINFSFKSIEM